MFEKHEIGLDFDRASIYVSILNGKYRGTSQTNPKATHLNCNIALENSLQTLETWKLITFRAAGLLELIL
jgi:hypothetical protein